MQSGVNNLKISDIDLVLSLSEATSIRELARKRKQTAGYISRQVKAVESILGQQIFVRTKHGVHLSRDGEQILSHLRRAVSEIRKIRSFENEPTERSIAIGYTSSIPKAVMVAVVAMIKSQFPMGNLTILQIPAAPLFDMSNRVDLDLCIYSGSYRWPDTWYSKAVGEIVFDLFVRNNHPIYNTSALDLATFPLALPSSLIESTNGDLQMKSAWDHHDEFNDYDMAVAMASQSNSLVYLPIILGRDIDSLSRVANHARHQVLSQVSLAVQSDRISKPLYNNVFATIKKQLIS